MAVIKAFQKIMVVGLVGLCCVFVCVGPAYAYPCSDSSPVGGLSFLLGDWVGQPKGQPIFKGFPGVLQSGDFTAHFELNKWVLILKSRTGHEDMMVIYAGCGSDRGMGALYIDSVRHTVQHCTWKLMRTAVQYPPTLSNPYRVIFESLPEPNFPTFRLAYTEITPGKISIELQIGALAYTSTAHRRDP